MTRRVDAIFLGAEGRQCLCSEAQHADLLPDWGTSDSGRRLFDPCDGAATPNCCKTILGTSGRSVNRLGLILYSVIACAVRGLEVAAPSPGSKSLLLQSNLLQSGSEPGYTLDVVLHVL